MTGRRQTSEATRTRVAHNAEHRLAFARHMSAILGRDIWAHGWHVAACPPIEAGVNAAASNGACHEERMMDELNGRMIACQILITGLIARVANDSPDPLRFLSDFRDEIHAVVNGINIAGMENTNRVRQTARKTVDELFSLMKAPSAD